MKASIIIPTFNRATQLKRTLLSLTRINFFKKSFEIIVIDNGSFDETKEIVDTFILEYYEHHVKYFYDEIPGLLTGRHRGAKEAIGEILIFIDDDIKVDENWLSAIVETFENNSDYHLVGGKCLPLYEITPPNWINQFWQYYPNGDKMFCELSLCDYGDQQKEIDPTWVFGLNFSIRKDTFFKLGGFHPDNISGILQHLQGDGETGLSLKMKAMGLKACYNPKALVHHEVPANRMTIEYFDKRFFYLGICNSYHKIRKNGGLNLPSKPFSLSEIFLIGKIKSIFRILFPTSIYSRRLNKISLNENEILHIRFKLNEQAGFDFHQEVARKSPVVLEWILKKNYLDYQLPKTNA